MSHGSYTFAAIKGRQGKYDYYLIQCPLRLVPRLLLYDEIEIPTSIRRTHTLDAARIDAIASYLAEHSETYVLAPIVATIDQQVLFEPIGEAQSAIGNIIIPITAHIIVQDGQHRRAAIQQIVTKNVALGNDTIPIMLIPDKQLTRSHQLYIDLNIARAKGSRSQRVLHEQSDLATLVHQLIDEVPLFQGRIELEKTTISNRSTALFTLSAIYQANEALLGVHKGEHIAFKDLEIAQRFWTELGNIIPEWQQIITQAIAPVYLRQNYIHSHTVTLLAIGKAGHELIKLHPDDWDKKLRLLEQIDWSRSNTALWEGRAMVLGKMSKAANSVKLSTSAIKSILGLQLTQDEQDLEQLLSKQTA